MFEDLSVEEISHKAMELRKKNAELNCPVDIVSQRALRKEIAPGIYDDLVNL